MGYGPLPSNSDLFHDYDIFRLGDSYQRFNLPLESWEEANTPIDRFLYGCIIVKPPINNWLILGIPIDQPPTAIVDQPPTAIDQPLVSRPDFLPSDLAMVFVFFWNVLWGKYQVIPVVKARLLSSVAKRRESCQVVILKHCDFVLQIPVD